MNIHYSYQFKNLKTNSWGYGDVVVENCNGPPRNAADLKELKTQIKNRGSDLADCILVILAWNVMSKGET